MARDSQRGMRVKDWMTPSPVTVSAEMPAAEARERMQTLGIRHVLVTKVDVLIGILSTRDLGPDRAAESSPALKASVTVGDLMTRSVVAIGAEAPVTAAAALMRRHRIGALPVFDRGRIVGIFTRTDLLGALVSALPVTSPSPRAGAMPVDRAPSRPRATTWSPATRRSGTRIRQNGEARPGAR